MDPIKQSRESLQTPINQPGSSGPSKLPQGVRESIRTQLLPMHCTQPLQTPVTSVGIQRPPRQMSPPLSGAWKQAAPWLIGPRLGISSDSSRPIQNPLHEVRIPLNCYTIIFFYNIQLYTIYFSRCCNYQNNLKI